MKRICGGCGTYMGEKDGPPEQVTHGLCPLCMEWSFLEISQLQQTESELHERLERLRSHIARRRRPQERPTE
jgi:hypothetical protein